MLPKYDKSNRRSNFVQLPKAAYVIKILSAKIVTVSNGSQQLAIAYDIAEGEYKDFYKGVFDRNSNEDKKWPNDGIFRLWIPKPDGQYFERESKDWDSFFGDLEDSNAGFVFNGDEKTLKGKLIGAKMHIEQSESNGKVYDHTRMKWSCIADDVRKGKAGTLPYDRLIDKPAGGATANPMDGYANGGFASTGADEIPFD